jgi:hypothetical protein
MIPTLRKDAIVQPDGTIVLSVPELVPGQRMRVTVEPEQARHVIDIVQNLPGHRLFKTAEEVDAFINEERDSWDR